MSWYNISGLGKDEDDRIYFDLNKEKIYCIEIVREFDGIENIEQFGCFKNKDKCFSTVHKMKMLMMYDKPSDIKLDIFDDDPLKVDLYMAIKRQECVKDIKVKETYLRW